MDWQAREPPTPRLDEHKIPAPPTPLSPEANLSSHKSPVLNPRLLIYARRVGIGRMEVPKPVSKDRPSAMTEVSSDHPIRYGLDSHSRPFRRPSLCFVPRSAHLVSLWPTIMCISFFAFSVFLHPRTLPFNQITVPRGGDSFSRSDSSVDVSSNKR